MNLNLNLKQLKAERRRSRQKEKKKTFKAAKEKELENNKKSDVEDQKNNINLLSQNQVPFVGKLIKFDHLSFDSLGISVKTLHGTILKISNEDMSGGEDSTENLLSILLKANKMDTKTRLNKRIVALTGEGVVEGEVLEIKWSEIINPQIY